jgi:hypothetical protein
MWAARLTRNSLVVNVYAEFSATIISKYVSCYCAFKNHGTVAAFYVGYFEGGILDLYLMTSQNIASLAIWLVLELLRSDSQISSSLEFLPLLSEFLHHFSGSSHSQHPVVTLIYVICNTIT